MSFCGYVVTVPDGDLAEIHRLAAANRIRLTAHAKLRMLERGAENEDVRSGLITATAATLQEDGRHEVTGGVDGDGDDLDLVVVVEADVVVVTLF